LFLEGPAPRVICRQHGVIVAAVPWARHGSWFTTAFEDQAAWLTAHTAKSTVSVLMRTSWRSVTSMVARVVAEARAGVDRREGLRRIGIDDKSYKKGHQYLMVVVDHDTGRVVWASEVVDEVRRRITRDTKAAGQPLSLGSTRWALLKAPEHLTGTQQGTLAQIKKTNGPLYRAYLIKEQLREVFAVKGEAGAGPAGRCDLLGDQVPAPRDGQARVT
jgi:transposase